MMIDPNELRRQAVLQLLQQQHGAPPMAAAPAPVMPAVSPLGDHPEPGAPAKPGSAPQAFTMPKGNKKGREC